MEPHKLLGSDDAQVAHSILVLERLAYKLRNKLDLNMEDVNLP